MHALAASQSPSGAHIIAGLLIWAAIIASYWIPTIVAALRHVPNTGSVAVINGLLGWTVIGWIIALAMACRSRYPQQIAVIPYAPAPFQPQPPQEDAR